MKKWIHIYRYSLLFFALFAAGAGQAQMVGSEIFLQGDYCEVGIATNGAFGTDNDAPAGYHARSPYGASGRALGFVADPDKDGWTVGTPTYFGDYYLPGTPQEGWDVQYNGNWERAWRGPTSGTTFTGTLTGTCTEYISTATDVKGVWEGRAFSGALRIKAITQLKKNKVYFTTTVQFKNTTSSTMYNIYYDRSVDADNEVQTVGGSGYTTDNKIVYRLPSENNKTLVTSLGREQGAYLGLGSRDCRARPYITNNAGPAVPNDLYPGDSLNNIFDSVTTHVLTAHDAEITSDAAIGIVFRIDSLRAGDSTVFSYAYILREADLDSAFEDLKPIFSFASRPYISNDTVYECEGETVDIDILNGDFYEWDWTPGTGLSTTKGSRVKLTIGSSIVTYTATPAPNGLCPIDPISITVVPVPPPAPPLVVSPLSYCRFDGAPPLTATPVPGSVLQWYTTRSGGTPEASMTPATNIPGEKYYYVSQLSGGKCESARDSILVITRDLPKIHTFTSVNPSACGASDASITFYVDSADQTYELVYDKNGLPIGPITIVIGTDGRYTLNGLSGGTYTNFVVKNKYGCTSAPFFGPIELVDPRPPGPPISHPNPYCIGDKATFRVPLIAGAVYNWTGPDGFTSTNREPTVDVTGTSAGTYTLIVRVGACVYLPSVTTIVLSPTPKKQNFAPVYDVCEYDRYTLTQIIEPNTSYIWSGKDLTLIDQPLSFASIRQSNSGKYYLTATSDNGCTMVDSTIIEVNPRPTLSLPRDTAICATDSAILYAETNGSAIEWVPADGIGNKNAFSTKAQPKQSTLYTANIQTGNACPDTSGTVNITIIPAPQVKGYDTLVRMNIPYTLKPIYGPEAIKWTWIPSDSLSCSDCPNPVFNSNRDITYVIKVSNQEGCSNAAMVNVRVFCDGANVTMPNAFTPNGDGNNDIFYVRGTGFTVKSFSIYNRLGQQIFSKENFMPNDSRFGWDGTFNGQEISDAAGFVYMIEVICFNSNNAPELIKGTVLMIK